jgi:hypothetical protein
LAKNWDSIAFFREMAGAAPGKRAAQKRYAVPVSGAGRRLGEKVCCPGFSVSRMALRPSGRECKIQIGSHKNAAFDRDMATAATIRLRREAADFKEWR